MKSLTEDRPKCLLEIAGKPLLHWQREALNAAGIDNILIVTGYRGEMIKGNFEFSVNQRWQETNMLSSLLCADDFILRSFKNGFSQIVVSYSDIVYHPDHIARLVENDFALAITYDTDWKKLWDLRFDNDVLSDAETFCQQDGLLREIGGKAKKVEEIQGQYMGLLKFDAQAWQGIKDICAKLGRRTDRIDMTAFLRLLLADNIPIGAVPVHGKWCEADNSEDLAHYEKALEKGGWSHDWRIREHL